MIIDDDDDDDYISWCLEIEQALKIELDAKLKRGMRWDWGPPGLITVAKEPSVNLQCWSWRSLQFRYWSCIHECYSHLIHTAGHWKKKKKNWETEKFMACQTRGPGLYIDKTAGGPESRGDPARGRPANIWSLGLPAVVTTYPHVYIALLPSTRPGRDKSRAVGLVAFQRPTPSNKLWPKRITGSQSTPPSLEMTMHTTQVLLEFSTTTQWHALDTNIIHWRMWKWYTNTDNLEPIQNGLGQF